MEAAKVDMFLNANSRYFEGYQIPFIHERLIAADDSKFLLLHSAGFKDPTISIIVSLFAGTFGIDRFIIGDTGLGVAKLLTCGGLYVWTIVDWFLIMGRTREVNMEKLQAIL